MWERHVPFSRKYYEHCKNYRRFYKLKVNSLLNSLGFLICWAGALNVHLTAGSERVDDASSGHYKR